MKKNYIVYLMLGSNISDKKKNIINGIKLINEHENIKVTSNSSLYKTKPWGYNDQNNFYNIALKIETTFSPENLLTLIQSIEIKLGREKNIKWGPRIIDVDIALFDDLIINKPNLIVPHKYLLERDFFLKPIIEIDKNSIYPATNKKLEYYLNRIEKHSIIEQLNFKIDLRCKNEKREPAI